MNARIRLLLPILFLVLGFQAMAQIGNELRILRIDASNYPKVRVYVRLYCNGVSQGNLQNFVVNVRDGEINRNFTISCPTEMLPFSVALCLDASGSMAGTSIVKVREGANDFVDLLQSYSNGEDEAAIVSFNRTPSLDQSMTTSKPLLHSAINSLMARDNTALWDAVALAIDQVVGRGRNAKKFVLVLSDGGDNSSRNYDLADVIAYAKKEGIPVFCIGIGYGDRRYLYQLQMLAAQTGGQYFEITSPEQIVDIFNAMASIFTEGKNECVIEYLTECPDGSERTVTITTDACGGLSATGKYTMPVDPNLSTLDITMDSVSVYSGGAFEVPVKISARSKPAPIKQLRFTITVPTPLYYDSTSTTGLYSELFATNIAPNGNVLTVQMDGDQVLTGSRTLMIIKGHAPVMDKDSVVWFTITDASKQTDTCLALKVRGTGARIIPRAKLRINCNQTVTTQWNRETSAYQPEAVSLTTTITNYSKVTSKKTRVRVAVPYGLELLSSPVDFLIAGDSIRPNSSATVTLWFKVLPTDSAKTLRVCIEVSADSGNTVVCCSDVKVTPALPKLQVWCTIPSFIRWDSVAKRYDPATFPVTVRIANGSPMAAKNVKATITMPNGFRLAFGSSGTVVPSPSYITRADTAEVTWMVTVLERPVAGTVRFCAMITANGDTAWCCQETYVESSPVRATMECGEPVMVVYDEEAEAFDSTSFDIGSMVKNSTGFPMEGVWARITLPPFLTLASGESETKYPGNSTIGPFDSTRVSWKLDAGRLNESQEGVICIAVSANNFTGAQCCIPARFVIKSAIPTLACSLDGPDTIRHIGGTYTPHPAVMRVTVTNVGNSVAKRITAALIQGADVSIDSTDSPLKVLADSLTPGVNVDGTFRLRISPRDVARYDTVRVTVYADNGGAVVCEKIIWIEAVPRPLLVLSCTAPDSLIYDDYAVKYEPGPFEYTLTAVNAGSTRMDSVSAEVLLPPNMEIVTGEQPVKMMTPQSLSPGDTARASWMLNAIPRSVTRVDTIRSTVRHRGMIADAVAPCGALIRIPRERRADIAPQCSLVGTITSTGSRFSPDTVVVRLVVRNIGDAAAYEVHAMMLDDARTPLTPTERADKAVSHIDPFIGAAVFTWALAPRTAYAGDTINVCMRISALRQQDLFCCVKLPLPRLDEAAIRTTCGTVDTVYYEPAIKGYPNPIILHTSITNPTTVAMDTIRAGVILPRDFETAPGEAREKIVPSLAAGASADLEWRLNAIADTSTKPRPALLRIQYFAGGRLSSCERTVVLMPWPQDSAHLDIACASPERIIFVNAEVGLSPSPFTFTVEMRNSGSLPLHGVSATLRLPAGVDLAASDSLTKLLPGTLTPGLRSAVSWTIVPRESFSPLSASFLVFVNCAELPEQQCQTTTIVDPIHRLVILALPVGTVARVGQTVHIPLSLANPDHVPLRSFNAAVRYDHTVVEPTGVITDGTLTSTWPLVDVRVTTPGEMALRGSSASSIMQDGILLFLSMRVISGDGTGAPFGIKHSDLIFTSASVTDTADVATKNGDIWTTGDCITGLDATGSFQLFQNTPNPFNPETMVGWFIPGLSPQFITLEVYDIYGRMVRVLESGLRSPGMHQTKFRADGLAGGTYFSVLRSGAVTLLKRMVLVK